MGSLVWRMKSNWGSYLFNKLNKTKNRQNNILYLIWNVGCISHIIHKFETFKRYSCRFIRRARWRTVDRMMVPSCTSNVCKETNFLGAWTHMPRCGVTPPINGAYSIVRGNVCLGINWHYQGSVPLAFGSSSMVVLG